MMVPESQVAFLTDCGRDVTAVADPATRKLPPRLPDLAIESIARGFFREASGYGFRPVDYLRFFNSVLELTGSEVPDRRNGAAPGPMLGNGRPTFPLDDGRVRVRRFEAGRDLETLSEWMRDETGRMFLLAGAMTRMLPLAEVLSDPGSRVGIVTLPDDTPIGAMAFLNIDPKQRKAELRKLIGDPSMRGRGFAKAATRLWIAYGLGTLDLHKIYLNTLDTNVRNIRLNEALGFRLEGIFHDEVFLNGRYHDVLRMAIWGT